MVSVDISLTPSLPSGHSDTLILKTRLKSLNKRQASSAFWGDFSFLILYGTYVFSEGFASDRRKAFRTRIRKSKRSQDSGTKVRCPEPGIYRKYSQSERAVKAENLLHRYRTRQNRMRNQNTKTKSAGSAVSLTVTRRKRRPWSRPG